MTNAALSFPPNYFALDSCDDGLSTNTNSKGGGDTSAFNNPSKRPVLECSSRFIKHCLFLAAIARPGQPWVNSGSSEVKNYTGKKSEGHFLILKKQLAAAFCFRATRELCYNTLCLRHLYTSQGLKLKLYTVQSAGQL